MSIPNNTMKKATTSDVLVIGGGSGGIAFANRAAAHGKTVTIFDDGMLGGACVNRGCVPKKFFWCAADRLAGIQGGDSLGIRAKAPHIDWQTLCIERDAYIERIKRHYAKLFQAARVRFVSGVAVCTGPHTVRCNDIVYRGTHIVIATGGKPTVPDIPGAALGCTSDDFFTFSTQPKRIAVIGSGYIAVELASLLHSFGSDTHLFCRKDRPLTAFDSDIGTVCADNMRLHGVTLHTHTAPTALTQTQNKHITVHTENKTYTDFSHVLWAIGRSPNTEVLDLDATGISCTERGTISVDAMLRTEQSHIFALGDCTDAPNLTPIAVANGRRLADALYTGADFYAAHTHGVIPTVVFTHPPIGSIGLAEHAARTRYETIRVYRNRFTAMYDVGSNTPFTSYYKLICTVKDERVVGLHAVGRGADELVQGFAVAMNMGATKRDFDTTIAVHPTAAEEFVTMR